MAVVCFLDAGTVVVYYLAVKGLNFPEESMIDHLGPV